MNNGGADWESIILRRYFKILDINMFVTNFVVLTQIESQQLMENTKYAHKVTDIIDKDRLQMAVEAILSFHDDNFNQSVPVYNFWPQKIFPNSKYYQAYPVNLVEPLNEFENIEEYIDEVSSN